RDSRHSRLSVGFRRSATQLSDLLLGPVADQLGERRLIIVSHGALNYIPFAALTRPNPPTTSTEDSLLAIPGEGSDRLYAPLVTAPRVADLASASTLAVLRRDIANRPPAPRALAVLADPIFSVKDERISRQVPVPSLPPELERSARESGVLFDRIPFTRQEADRILDLVDATQATKAFGSEASRELALDPQLRNYRILHFATHGLLNSSSPELSGLAFSLVDEQGNPKNGFLRLHDIFNLELPAELVVLSACQTGLGELIRGEGTVGLPRGFLYAGAKRVVVSLWNVDDQGTAELMTDFYRQLLAAGQSPTAAMRAAQLQMWSQPEWRSPYYWAAFTVQGEW
ncbi:MAG: CHAT domain-containing protein, partial [Spirulinaceae cyanobacterium RM2_2_10]|nr:CHAT domain-containing protein [Spirulinaceae cyanobacterium RM2_2_10]